jgi:hypothetical protein
MPLRFGNWRDSRMAIVTSYFDASGGSDQIVVASAAVVASPEIWEEFDRRWNSCLAAFDVSALHMKDFAHSNGEFEKWKCDEPKRRRFLNGLLWIIEDLVEFTSVCSVYIDDYRYADKYFQLSESMRPYTLGSLTCASRIVMWAVEQGHDIDDLIWVFEKGDQDQSDLRKHWDLVYPDANVSPIFCKKRDIYPDKDKCRHIRPFEVADLIAYEHLQVHRLLDKKQGEVLYVDQLRRPIQRMRNWPSAKDWHTHDVASLENLCSHWNVQPR